MSDPVLRTSAFTGRRSVIATGRSDRPGGGSAAGEPPQIDPGDDPFLEGNEDQTPRELDADRPGGGPADGPGWVTRVIPNEYPLLLPAPQPPPAEAVPELFGAVPATGRHEVVVQAPGAQTNLVQLGADGVARVVSMWQRRLRAHAGAPARHLFCNEGEAAGASQPHTHAQLVVFDHVPRELASERERAQAYWEQTQGANLATDYLAEEVRRAERIVAIDEEAVLLAPFCSRSAYHLTILPRRSAAAFEAEPAGIGGAMLHDALRRLAEHFGAPPPLNMYVRTVVSGAEHTSWRIELLPVIDRPGGVEIGAGVDVCTVAPETAAAELRDL